MKKGNSGVNMAIRLLLLREYLLANAVKEHPKRRGETLPSNPTNCAI